MKTRPKIFNAVDLGRVHTLAEAMRAKAQVAQQQRTGRSWYRIENAAAEGGTTSVYIYDMIGEWGVSAQDFVGELRAIKSEIIDLHVNSEGGEVFDGLAIYESLRRHPAAITAYVDGLAASAASFIVCAADRVIMAERARLMIHDAHGLTMGNARDMRQMADLLDELSDTIADIYAEKAGGTRALWRTAMQAGEGGPDGTWYDAGKAVKAGLADEVQNAKGEAVAAHFHLDNAPKPPADTSWVTMDPPRADAGPSSPDRSLIEPPPAPPREPEWDPDAFLRAVREVDEYEPPAPIPDGQALRTLFDPA